jgi:plastocyanin
VLVFALSTAHKLGIGLAVLVFSGFSLIVSMVIPRRSPQFPGRRLPAFLAVSVLLFVGTLAAYAVFGREKAPAANASISHRVAVQESEFKIQLPTTTFSPGTYTFVVTNVGKVPHNLVISGPGGTNRTPNIAPGQNAPLTIDLKPGQYDFYCSIPGHKAAGMDQKVTVS